VTVVEVTATGAAGWVSGVKVTAVVGSAEAAKVAEDSAEVETAAEG
jgi:hypothetical protein